MKYRLTVVPELMNDEWWANGGAMLWHEFGGGNNATLLLTEEEFERFQERAEQIDGWRHQDGVIDGVLYGGDVSLLVQEEQEDETEGDPKSACCPRCERPVHPALKPLWGNELIPVPRHTLNHALTALQEAVVLAQRIDPLDGARWHDALADLIRALEAQHLEVSLATPKVADEPNS